MPQPASAHKAAAVPTAWPWAMQLTVLRVDMWARWSEVIIIPAHSRLSRPVGRNARYGHAVGAAVLHLEARGHVVEAVGHHVVVEMPAFDHVLVRDIVVADDQPPAPDVQRRTGAGDERLLAAGDVLAGVLDPLPLLLAQLQLGLGGGVAVRGTDRHPHVELDEHEVVVVHRGHEQTRLAFGPRAVEPHDLARDAIVQAQGEIARAAVVLDVLHDLVEIDTRDADAVGHVVVVGLAVLGPGVCRQMAVGGGIDEGLGRKQLASRAAFHDRAADARAVHRRPHDHRVKGQEDPRFAEHLHAHELVDLGIDRGVHGIVVVPCGHLRVTRAPAGLGQAIHDLAGDALDHLALLDAGEGLPQIEEAVQRGAAFDDGPTGVAFDLDQSAVLAPWRAAASAATTPAVPPPATTTSNFRTGIFRAGSS